MACGATVDAVDVRQPNLVDSADKWRKLQFMGIFYLALQLGELCLSFAPRRQILLQKNPREDSQEGQTQQSEGNVQRAR